MADTLTQCVNQPYEFVTKQMREKRHKTSFLSQAIENNGSNAEMAFINKWSALSLFLGGADTVSSYLSYTQPCKCNANDLADCFLTDDLLLSNDAVPRSAEESPRGT